MKLKGLIKIIQKLPTIPRIAVYVLIFIAFRFLLDALLGSLHNLRIMKEGMSNGKNFVLFHWEKCGHCKKMMPEWNKFESMYSGPINIKKVEKDEDPSLVSSLGIKGFPTIVMMDGNSKVADYSGDRKAESFMEYVKGHE
tara:strand:+ start:1440 stop:1859 length:420 start_codon:yes stop_codon:yes gene_type:complete